MLDKNVHVIWELPLAYADRLRTETDLNQTLNIYNFVITLIYMYDAKRNINNDNSMCSKGCQGSCKSELEEESASEGE